MKRSDRSRGESGVVDGFEALGLSPAFGTAPSAPEHPATAPAAAPAAYPAPHPMMAPPPAAAAPALFPGMFPPPVAQTPAPAAPAFPAPNAAAPNGYPAPSHPAPGYSAPNYPAPGFAAPAAVPDFPAPTANTATMPSQTPPAAAVSPLLFPPPGTASAQPMSAPAMPAPQLPQAQPQAPAIPVAPAVAPGFGAPAYGAIADGAAMPSAIPNGPFAPAQPSAPAASPAARASRIAGRPGSERFTAPTHSGIPSSAAAPLAYRPGLVEAPQAPKKRMSVGRRLLSVAVFAFIGMFIVGVSVPANAFFHPSDDGVAALTTDAPSLVGEGPHQQVQVGDVQASTATNRDGYTVQTAQQLAQEQWWSGDGGWPYTITTGAIRWPFPYHVPISSGYGPRVSPCAGCSSFHEGDDFVPGAGAEIFTTFAGKVTVHVQDDWSYGNYVEVDAHIRGHVVTALYAHMKPKSSPLKVGDEVTVGQFVGLVGETGEATGPHLHFEIRVDGVKQDPYKWLLKNATNNPTVPE